MSKSRVAEYDDTMSDTEVPQFSSPAAASAAESINELAGPTTDWARARAICDGSPEAAQLIPPEDRYVPISLTQLGDLTGQLLTVIEVLGLDANQESALKSVIRRQARDWYATARENSETSVRGCLAPIIMVRDANGKERKTIWTAEGSPAVSLNL